MMDLSIIRTTAAAAILTMGCAGAADAAVFEINAATASANNRQSFDVDNDVWLLNTSDFPIFGPLVFANDVGGDPGLAGTALDDITTFAGDVNVIVLQNFDNNDTDGFPANWDNSFNARRALEAIANNTDGDRPGFYLYWNETLGVNRLVYTQNLNDGAAALQILFAINSDNLVSNTDNLQLDPTFRGEANANFQELASFTADNFQAVPAPAGWYLLLSGVAGVALLRRHRAN